MKQIRSQYFEQKFLSGENSNKMFLPNVDLVAQYIEIQVNLGVNDTEIPLNYYLYICNQDNSITSIFPLILFYKKPGAPYYGANSLLKNTPDVVDWKQCYVTKPAIETAEIPLRFNFISWR